MSVGGSSLTLTASLLSCYDHYTEWQSWRRCIFSTCSHQHSISVEHLQIWSKHSLEPSGRFVRVCGQRTKVTTWKILLKLISFVICSHLFIVVNIALIIHTQFNRICHFYVPGNTFVVIWVFAAHVLSNCWSCSLSLLRVFAWVSSSCSEMIPDSHRTLAWTSAHLLVVTTWLLLV